MATSKFGMKEVDELINGILDENEGKPRLDETLNPVIQKLRQTRPLIVQRKQEA